MARRAAAKGLGLLVLALAATGALASCSWGYGMGYGSYGYGSYGNYGNFTGVGYGYGYGGYGYGCVDLGASPNNYGHLRGVGPYASCKGAYMAAGATTEITTDSMGAITLTASDNEGAVFFNYTASSTPSCVDAFTGLAMPFPMTAAIPGNGNFSVSAVTTVTALAGMSSPVSGTPAAKRAQAYGLYYNSSFAASQNAAAYMSDYNPFTGLASSNVGMSSYDGAVLASDTQALGFITVGAAYLVAVGATTNMTLAASAITAAAFVNFNTMPLVLTNATQVNATLYKARSLLDSSANSTMASSMDVATAMASGASIINDITVTFVSNSKAPWMIMGDVVGRVVRLAQVSWVQQSLLVAAIKTQLAPSATGNALVAFSTPAAIQALMPTATIMYDNIYKALGLPAQGSADSLTINVQVAGGLKNCAGNFTTKWTATTKALKTMDNGTVIVAQPTPGTLLFGDMSGNTCEDTATYIKQKFIFGAVVPTTGNVKVTPMSAMTIFQYHNALSKGPAVFAGSLYNDVYAQYGYDASKYGVSFLDWSGAAMQGGALPVSTSAVNLQLQGLFSVGSSLLIGLNASWAGKPNVVPFALLQMQYYMSAYEWKGKPQMANKTSIGMVLNGTYEAVNGSDFKNVDITANRRRALLQTASASIDPALIEAIITSVSASLASTNARLEAVRTEAMAAADAAAAGTPNATYSNDFALAQIIVAAKVAVVQQSQLAADVQAIAAQVAAGTLTLAQLTTALTNLETSYSAAALDAKIAAAVVNVDALAAANGQSTPKKAASLAIPLGVGIGVGLPALIALIALTVYYVKTRREAQGINPASQPLVGRPMGESVERAAFVAIVSAAEHV